MTVSSLPDTEPAAATGAWFNGERLIEVVAVDDRSPPPVAPLSCTLRVRRSLGMGLTALSMKLTELVASVLRSALTCATVPMIVTEPVPDPSTDAPLDPAVRVRTPSATESVVVTRPPAASTSAIESPPALRFRLVWPMAVNGPAMAATGGSFTGVTVRLTVAIFDWEPPLLAR